MGCGGGRTIIVPLSPAPHSSLYTKAPHSELNPHSLLVPHSNLPNRFPSSVPNRLPGEFHQPRRNLVEIIELKGHPGFLGTQAHPEFQSKPNKAHPLFAAFIAATLKGKKGGGRGSSSPSASKSPKAKAKPATRAKAT